MVFTLSIFLYIYYGFIVIWGLFFLAGLYHIVKYGARNFITPAVTMGFIGVAVLMLFFSFYFIGDIYWDEEVRLFQGVMEMKNPYTIGL